MKHDTNKMADPPRRQNRPRGDGAMRVRCVICNFEKTITRTEASNLADNPVCDKCLGPMIAVEVRT